MSLDRATLADLAATLEEVAEHLDADADATALDLVTRCRQRLDVLLDGEAEAHLTRAIVDHVADSPTRCSCGAVYATATEYAPRIAFAKHQAAQAADTLY